MQVSVETTSGLERQITITVPSEQIENDVNQRLQQTARSVRIDGFRPGKAPLSVIKKRYGAGAREEVLQKVIQETLFKAATDNKLQPAGTPSVDYKNNKSGEDFVYVASFEVYPEIKLTDFSKVTLTKEESEVADADVEQMIETLRKQKGDWEEVTRMAKDGDRVNINFVGTIDGEEFPGGKGEGMDLILGSNTMIPGFEKNLVKAKAGEEKELEVTFPDDYQAEELQGKVATFVVKVNTVSKPLPAELNKELFAEFGIKTDSVEGFSKEVRANMERELENSLKSKLKDHVFQELVAANEVELPTSLVDNEIDVMRKQAVQQFGGAQAEDFDINLLPKEMFEEQATKRVTLGLLVQEFIRENKIKATEKQVQSALKEMAATYQDSKQVIEYYTNNPEMLSQIENLVTEDKVVDKLLATATVKTVKVKYEEGIKPAQQA